MAKVQWIGTPPTKCELCHSTIRGKFVDGKTVFGPWAIMCVDCHTAQGRGYGTGRGQLYVLNSEGKWEQEARVSRNPFE